MTVERSEALPLDAVLLDFDGVVVESVEIKRAGFQLLFESYGPDIQQAAYLYDLANHGLSRFEKFRWCCEELLKVDPSEEVMADLDRRFSAAILERVLVADFVPGAVEFLGRWSPWLDCFVVSAAPQEEIEYLVDERDLTDFFVSVHGSPVPKVDQIAHLVETHNLDPARTAMVGDAVSDFDAADACGVPFVARLRPGATEPFDLARCRAALPDLVDLDDVLGLDTVAG